MLRLALRTARPGRAQDLLPVLGIDDEVLRLSGGRLRAVLDCATLAFGIKGEAEQRAIVLGWSALLNSLGHPLTVALRTRAVDRAAVAPLPATAPGSELRASYDRLVETLARERRVVDRRVLVIVPYDPPVRRAAQGDGRETLDQRVRWMREGLARLDLAPRVLSGSEIADLVRRALDDAAARQPLGATDALRDARSLLAPPALAERVSSVAVGERLARTLAVVRYPAHIHPGWLDDLTAFDGDLDVALHAAPVASTATMAFLERRVGELSSTIRAAEARGARVDPYRRVALQDALELRDRIAQGSERLFDVTLLATVWADSADELEARTRSLEALFGARLVQTRRLLFQMRAGLTATLPLGDETVRVPRVLSTAALAAAFPFTGGDVRSSGGLLYGIATHTRGAVILDRFALENHNAVVFASSGAGKSFLAKCELARATLAGHRVFVVDPEGEYVRLAGALGMRAVHLAPGTTDGLDPFVIAERGPGALATRVAALRTLIGLLAGGVDGAADALVDAAIVQSYRATGRSGDEDAPHGRTPALADVVMHLDAHAETRALAARLARHTTGSSAWLFRRDAPRISAEGESVVFSLAGLPEEERTAAMFLVLDAVWSRIADATRPTLIVVDEAWWLMRSPETARYLVRIVKTARKRRAGLTL
ncbi:MAG TPA: DUF87 domain-containing protein, partial [Candidatus Acidoferrales bacterium]|nr:DUF87 domain-containing protein [Candidatus Acidoferrales bacterium]